MNIRRFAITSVRFATILLLVFASAVAALAQAGRGGINGIVTDPTGAIIPGAKVLVENRATGIRLSTVSSSAGLYSFVSLAPGTYEVSASAKGFQTALNKTVRVSVDQVSTVNIPLPVGNVSEVLNVNGHSSMVR